MARKVGQIVGRGPRTWLVCVYNGRGPETKKRNYLTKPFTADCWTLRLISTRCWARGSRPESRFIEANTESVPGPLARDLRQASIAREEPSRLRRAAAPLRAPSTWHEGGGNCFRARHPDAVSRTARPKLVRPLDPLHPRNLAVSAQAGGPLEPHFGESGRLGRPTQAKPPAFCGILR